MYHIKLLEDAYVAMSKSDVKRITAEITLMRMALAKYDSSFEALEARIAELEASLASGTVIKAPESPTVPSVPKVSAEKPVVPKTEAKPTATKAEKQPTSANAETAVAAWVDIVEAYGAKDPSASSFLKNTKATYNPTSGQLTVWVLDGFGKMMLDTQGAPKTIASLAGRFGLSVANVLIAIKPKNISHDDPLADLL